MLEISYLELWQTKVPKKLLMICVKISKWTRGWQNNLTQNKSHTFPSPINMYLHRSNWLLPHLSYWFDFGNRNRYFFDSIQWPWAQWLLACLKPDFCKSECWAEASWLERKFLMVPRVGSGFRATRGLIFACQNVSYGTPKSVVANFRNGLTFGQLKI